MMLFIVRSLSVYTYLDGELLWTFFYILLGGYKKKMLQKVPILQLLVYMYMYLRIIDTYWAYEFIKIIAKQYSSYVFKLLTLQFTIAVAAWWNYKIAETTRN